MTKRWLLLMLFLVTLLTGINAASSETPNQAITYSDEAAIHRIRRIAIFPFRHTRGPYFGEVCRQQFYSLFKKKVSPKAEIVDEGDIRNEISAQFGDKDIEISHGQGLSIARKLGADTTIFGLCAPPDIYIYFMDVATGRIICDAGLPKSLRRTASAQPNRMMRILVEQFTGELPCVNCSDAPATSTVGYAIPHSAAVLPIAGDAGQDGEAFRLKTHVYLREHGIDSIDLPELDSGLATAFFSSDVAHLQNIQISSISAALGVDAVFAIEYSSVSVSKWSVNGAIVFGFSPLPIPILLPSHTTSERYVNVLLYTKNALPTLSAIAPYSNAVGSFELIRRQFPAWLQ